MDVWDVVAQQLRANGAAPGNGGLDKRDARALVSLARCSRQMRALFRQRLLPLARAWPALRWCGKCQARVSDYDSVCDFHYTHANSLCIACTVSMCSRCGRACYSKRGTHCCTVCEKNFCAGCATRYNVYHFDCGTCASCYTLEHGEADRSGNHIGVRRPIHRTRRGVKIAAGRRLVLRKGQFSRNRRR